MVYQISYRVGPWDLRELQQLLGLHLVVGGQAWRPARLQETNQVVQQQMEGTADPDQMVEA